MSASAPIGEYARIVAQRNAILANVSPALRKRLLGKRRRLVPPTVAPKATALTASPLKAQPGRHEMPLDCWAIINAVADAWGVSVDDLRAPKRDRRFAYPRFAAQLLIRERNGWSTPKIGKLFGGRDHSTVMAAVKRAKGLRETLPCYRNRYEAAQIALAGGVC